MLLVLDDYHLIDSPAGACVARRSCSSICRRTCTWCWPAGPTRRCRWRGCGPRAACRAARRRPALHRWRRRPPCCARRSVPTCLPDAAVAALAARTEGWAAGLQLAALSLRGQPDVAGFVATFSGSHRYVLDYLAEEVLEGQTAQVRGFLLETSVLDRLSGNLCDAVTGAHRWPGDAGGVERANLFLVPAGRGARLVALPPPVRRPAPRPPAAAAARPGARRCIVTRLRWYEVARAGRRRRRHALAAGDAAWAARLIEQHFDAVFLPGERDDVAAVACGAARRRWSGSRPRLLPGAGAMAGIAGGHVEAAGEPLDARRARVRGCRDEPFEPSAGKAASLW